MSEDQQVATLLGDSGTLRSVSGVAADDQFESVLFEFANGGLELTCSRDTSEIRVRCCAAGAVSGLKIAAFADLIDTELIDAWLLTNHRGYTDALQLRFARDGDAPATWQFEVVASGMYAHRVMDDARPKSRASKVAGQVIMSELTARFLNEADVITGVSGVPLRVVG